MQTCNNCYSQFIRKDIIKSIWLREYSPLACKDCNTKHYVNRSTRWIIGLGVAMPMFFNLFFDNRHYIFPMYILWLVVLIYLTPFFAMYHNKK